MRRAGRGGPLPLLAAPRVRAHTKAVTRYSLPAACGRAGILVLSLALAACTSAAPPKAGPARSATPGGSATPSGTTPASAEPAPPAPSAVHTGFVGYRWTVTAISDGGPYVPVPARYAVYLAFYRDGMFVGNEPVNTHSGPYRVTLDGFTVGDVATSLVCCGGGDQASVLAIRAMQAFSGAPGTHAVVDVTGDRMTVSVKGFTLRCTRAAKATAPAPFPPHSIGPSP
jgi:heat shock protein HslJ